MENRDARYKKIKVGDKVVYPCRRASSCFLRQGYIVGFKYETQVVIKSIETGCLNHRNQEDVVRVQKG